MNGLRLLGPGLLAVLLAGCGLSSVNDLGPESQRLGTAQFEPAGATEFARSVEGRDGQVNNAVQARARDVASDFLGSSSPSSDAYKVGPRDSLEISVFKVPELSKVVQVSEGGTVNYPLIGEFPASGRTPRELEQYLTKVLGAKYLEKPQVTVNVREYNSQRYTIEGSVTKPGVFPMQGGMTLMQALAISQGLTSIAQDDIVVFRTSNGQRSVARFSVSELRSGNAVDPTLQSGDVIVASNSALKEGLNNVLKMLPLASVFAML